jgi:hypothetical protein
MGMSLGSKNKLPFQKERSTNFYWGIVSSEYARELAAFKRMHDRVRDGKCPSILWPRTLDGFVMFMKEIGKIPSVLNKPSVGRILHQLGYEPNNVQWEEHRINSVKRKGTKHEHSTAKILHLNIDVPKLFARVSPEAAAFRIANVKRYWADPNNRLKRSETLRILWKKGAFKNRKKKGKTI